MEVFVHWWPLALLLTAYVMAVFCFAVGRIFDGGDWWEPFALPVAVPGIWLYVHRVPVGIAALVASIVLGVSS